MRDFDRQLDERGVEEAIAMGRLMLKRKLVPDIIFCSTAARAVQTLDAVNEALHLNDIARYDQNLYATDAPGYLEIAAAAGDAEDVMLVGHNPMLEDTAIALSKSGDDVSIDALHRGFRTAGLAVIDFEGPAASFISATGHLEAFLTPEDAP